MAETCRDLACMKCESDYCHCCKYPMEEADKVEKIVRADERAKVVEELKVRLLGSCASEIEDEETVIAIRKDILKSILEQIKGVEQ